MHCVCAVPCRGVDPDLRQEAIAGRQVAGVDELHWLLIGIVQKASPQSQCRDLQTHLRHRAPGDTRDLPVILTSTTGKGWRWLRSKNTHLLHNLTKPDGKDYTNSSVLQNNPKTTGLNIHHAPEIVLDLLHCFSELNLTILE